MADYIASETPDASVLTELGTRLGKLRVSQNLTQQQLARACGVSLRTLARLEAGHNCDVLVLIRVLRGLGLLDNLNILVPASLPSPVELTRRAGRQRVRARGASSVAQSKPFKWGDES